MKKRAFNLISALFNLLTVIFVAESVIYNFRSDIIRVELVGGGFGWGCFKYFTVLSNVFCAVVAAVCLYFNARNVVKDEFVFPRFLKTVKATSTVAVSLTMLTVVFFLGPYAVFIGKSYFALFERNNLFLHLLCPMLAIIAQMVEVSEKRPFVEVLFALIPTFLYEIVYTVMVVFVRGWKDFYGFTFGGHFGLTPVAIVVMLGVTFGIAAVEKLVFDKFAARHSDLIQNEEKE